MAANIVYCLIIHLGLLEKQLAQNFTIKKDLNENIFFSIKIKNKTLILE